ncbi:MAG: flavin reductase family protein [Candidatus Latescibacteria bacterium]|nr:flavin reductase family protein [Candidatus Latescibacterota bacterium]MBT4138967.1 flavin reductase family protein [Candidatus Latescibacterota bacterium]
MFFTPGNHPNTLSNNPFNAIVVPRPIGWISTLSKSGIPNLAPYSFFNAVAYDPPQVMFAATSSHTHGGQKDSVQNAQDTGEFVVNVVTYDLREHMNTSAVSAPPDINEFEYANLTQEPSEMVKAPRVAESPIHLECTYTQTVELPTDDPAAPNTVIFGQVVGIHIREEVIKEGKLDLMAIQPVGRLGYLDYVHVTQSFNMDRPTWS